MARGMRSLESIAGQRAEDAMWGLPESPEFSSIQRAAAKRSNTVPGAEPNGNIRAGAFVPPRGSCVDQQSAVRLPRLNWKLLLQLRELRGFGAWSPSGQELGGRH
jgi:hypothetical protein